MPARAGGIETKTWTVRDIVVLLSVAREIKLTHYQTPGGGRPVGLFPLDDHRHGVAASQAERRQAAL